MYLGHFAVALAGKRAAPDTSLGTLIAASQLIDLIWPLLVLMGLERVAVDPGITVVNPLDFTRYPITHSLLAVLVWASFFASVYWLTTRKRAGSLVLWFAVLSHWVLDYVTHIPDLPLYPGSDKMVGLGLWNSLLGTLALEVGLFILGLVLYLRTTRPANRTGTYSLAALVVFLILTYFASVLGPPPPNGKVVAWSALLLWLLVPWGYWIDRNRISKFRAGSRKGKLRFK